jgi:transposase-like protein
MAEKRELLDEPLVHEDDEAMRKRTKLIDSLAEDPQSFKSSRVTYSEDEKREIVQFVSKLRNEGVEMNGELLICSTWREVEGVVRTLKGFEKVTRKMIRDWVGKLNISDDQIAALDSLSDKQCGDKIPSKEYSKIEFDPIAKIHRTSYSEEEKAEIVQLVSKLRNDGVEVNGKVVLCSTWKEVESIIRAMAGFEKVTRKMIRDWCVKLGHESDFPPLKHGVKFSDTIDTDIVHSLQDMGELVDRLPSREQAWSDLNDGSDKVHRAKYSEEEKRDILQLVCKLCKEGLEIEGKHVICSTSREVEAVVRTMKGYEKVTRKMIREWFMKIQNGTVASKKRGVKVNEMFELAVINRLMERELTEDVTNRDTEIMNAAFTYDMFRNAAEDVRKLSPFSEDPSLQKLVFSNGWVQSLKRRYQIRNNTMDDYNHDISYNN